jgi:hypothetical protein
MKTALLPFSVTFICLVCTANASADEWVQCANENETCAFSGEQLVRYGADGKFYYQVAAASVACNNDKFGDPLVGTVKACHTRAFGNQWTECAKEHGACNVSGTQLVRYGANGSFVYQVASGSVDCNNDKFGDPIVGTVKACDVQPLD